MRDGRKKIELAKYIYDTIITLLSVVNFFPNIINSLLKGSSVFRDRGKQYQ